MTGVTPLAGFLLAVVVVLVVCHASGELLHRCGQPRVVGEIMGGLLLGPAVLGQVWPRCAAVVFSPEIVAHVDRVAQLGLIFFMMSLAGLRPNTTVRPRVVAWVTAGSLGLPLVAGALLGLLAGGTLAGQGAPRVACAVFLGLALAITALPVLGRILVDLGLGRTKAGTVAVAAAVVGDLLVWTALPLLLIATDASAWTATTGVGLVLLAAATLGLRRSMPRLERLADRRNADQPLLAMLVVGALGLGAVAEVAGLHPAIGAFVFGLAIPPQAARLRLTLRRLQRLTLVVLLPLFFAGVGLRTSVNLFNAVGSWLILAAVLIAAASTKIIGAGLGARLAGFPAAGAWRIGVLANCRGVTELVVATIGLQHGLISPFGFTALVLVAAITTAATGPLLRARFARPVLVVPIPEVIKA